MGNMDGNSFPEGPRPEPGGVQPTEKSVMMPNREEMAQKLQEAGLLGMTPQSDEFFNKFIDSVADNKKVGLGLNLDWEFAVHNILGDSPLAVMIMIGMYFDRVVDTVTPDPGVANQAKELRKQFLEKMRKRR